MFLNKLKVLSILVLGVVLGLGVGIFGSPGALTSAVFAEGEQAVQKRADPEPIDGQLLLDEQVQKELRLSKNQIHRIQAVSQDVDAKSESKRRQVKALQDQIDELRKRMDELGANVNSINTQIEDTRNTTLGKAAPDILSEKSVTRLRQIQRQKRGLNDMLTDAAIQRMLKIDDEQVKKIETIVKTDSFRKHFRLQRDGSIRVWDTAHGNALWIEEFYANRTTNDVYANTALNYLALSMAGHTTWNVPALQKLFDVLNPGQQRRLAEFLGEPYDGTSWHALRAKAK